jgi:phage terminase large subunit-like protein
VPRLKHKPTASDDRITADDVIAFIEQTCLVPEGKLVGQPLILQEWQRDFLRSIYDRPGGTRRAILSVGRKSAKSTLAACLLLAHLCGPPARRRLNSQLFSAAQSRDQAGIIFSLAAKMIRLNPVLAKIVRIQETAKSLICPELGTTYRALSAEASTAYGLSPSFVIWDELGQVRGPRSPLFEALETATAAVDNPLSVIISTQAPTDADLLSVLIDDSLAGHDPKTLVKLYTAPTDLDPFIESTVRLANPALGTFQHIDEVMSMAAAAKRMPARESEYRNLVLNQRIEVTSAFIAPAAWNECGESPGSMENLTLYGGLDLSTVSDLTALVLIGWRENRWRVFPTFWLPAEGLVEKGTADRVPYDLWRSQNHLVATPGKVVSYEMVAKYLKDLFSCYNIVKVGFDRWHWKHLKPWLLATGLSENFLEDRFVEFGQGYASLSPVMRDLESAILEGKLAHGNHPVLTWNLQNTVVVLDDAGNRKPSKRKSNGRIDGTVALCMALGVAVQPKKIDITSMIA